jgi:hypothetical protein
MTEKVNTTEIIGYYQKKYEKRFGVKPRINGAVCGKLIKELRKDYTEKRIKRIIELFFDDPKNENKSFHLPSILSAWSINTYLPKSKDNPLLFG